MIVVVVLLLSLGQSPSMAENGDAGRGGARVSVIGVQQALRVLFGALPNPAGIARCESSINDRTIATEADRVRCLIAVRYARDPEASKLALDLYERTGAIAGLLPEQDFDGGYRGMLHLKPHLPEGGDRKHLQFVSTALVEFDRFFSAIESEAGAPARYRWRPLELRFFESVRQRTPAAFVSPWMVAYNVRGTLNDSATTVRDLLFHEIFHLNDAAHGNWSTSALREMHGAIALRCGRKITCLEPYAPGWLKVRGGTYYAFMPGNGVEEYAAELALDYFREQLATRDGRGVVRPFKCGPPENARAWRLLVDEFFTGVDRTPPCKPEKAP